MSERNVNSEPEAAASRLQGRPGAFTHWLIHQAARRAPPDLSARLEEEWQADLSGRSSITSRLRFALGCCWATGVILREYRPKRVPVASAAIIPKVAVGYFSDEPGKLGRRSLTFFLVAGLHVVLFYALMTGLTFKILKVIPAPFQNRILETPHERALPQPPPPQLTRSRIEIPTPYFLPAEIPEKSGDIMAALRDTALSPPDAPPVILPHEPTRLAGGPGPGFPNTDDYYPSLSRHLEEEGATTVRVCVDANGRLTSDPTVVQTSGRPRLDEGALRLAKAGSGHYRASTEDGRSVNSCYAFRVRFTLTSNR